MPHMPVSDELTRDQLLEIAIEAAGRCRGGAVSNPRYFIEMLVGCLAANPTMDRIALLQITKAIERTADLQHEAGHGRPADGWVEMNVDQSLAVLQDWLGGRVVVTIDAPSGPSGLIYAKGKLEAAPHMVDLHEIDEDLYAFRLAGSDLEFRFTKTYFNDASFSPAKQTLSIGYGGTGDGTNEVIVEITREP